MVEAIYDRARQSIQIGNQFHRVPPQCKDIDTVSAYARCAGYIPDDAEVAEVCAA